VKTLHVRMQRHETNAKALAIWLDAHPQVEKVIYPGLPSHPQHALAKKQQHGFGGMISFVLRGGLDAARRFLSACKLFTLAESLGGVESLIEHPAIMTHASVPADKRAALGIVDGFIRISVGIEDLADLKADLSEAFIEAGGGIPTRKVIQAIGTVNGLRSTIYKVDDLAKAKAFYTSALGRPPYFDQPFYVGYDVDGQELGLDPDVSSLRPGPGGAVAYWKVDYLEAACERMAKHGGKVFEAPHDVGEGIRVAVVTDVCGNLVGLIETSEA
jgi:predicted enzyme related to lactoylglutathione lyase